MPWALWPVSQMTSGFSPSFCQRPRSEVFPWCRIDPMVTPAFLWHERELCYQSQTTPDCRTRCSGCGANRLLKGGVCNG